MSKSALLAAPYDREDSRNRPPAAAARRQRCKNRTRLFDRYIFRIYVFETPQTKSGRNGARDDD